jgi:hypothetical protein
MPESNREKVQQSGPPAEHENRQAAAETLAALIRAAAAEPPGRQPDGGSAAAQREKALGSKEHERGELSGSTSLGVKIYIFSEEGSSRAYYIPRWILLIGGLVVFVILLLCLESAL